MSLEKYLADNIVKISSKYVDYTLNLDVVKKSGKIFPQKDTFSLDELLNEAGKSFYEMLFFKIDISEMTDV